MFKNFISFVRDLYNVNKNTFIPLHEPVFIGNEKKYIIDVIDSTFVSSVGRYVNLFEEKIQAFTGIDHAITTVNGTSALHIALKAGGVTQDDEVITQSLTFVATCNAIRYCGARPIFLDISNKNLSLCHENLEYFLKNHCEIRSDGFCWNKNTKKRVSACVPMNTFGLSAKMDQIYKLCKKYNILLVEDAAESLGSLYKNKHCCHFSDIAILSFNGNKVITTGGGGMVLTRDKNLAKRIKHLTTTAKVPHKWEFNHDEIGYNYRMPNLNAALGVAQLENIDILLKQKKIVANKYHDWGDANGINFIKEPAGSSSNYWLNAMLLENLRDKELFLQQTNDQNIMTRPAWTPMHLLKMNADCYSLDMKNTMWFFDRIVNVPSSPIIDEK